MPGITALVHTHNDALRIGRCLETLYPCDEILIVDHGSEDSTVRVAREYGARITQATSLREQLQCGLGAARDWILCLEARESLTENLAASLYEWKVESPQGQPAFSIFVREETAEGWVGNPTAQTRLVPSLWNQWNGNLPTNQASACTLEGELLRFILP